MELLLPHPSNSSPLTVLGYLERAASVYGDSPSLLHATTVRTWSETHSRCLRIASTLASSSLGINRGQVVSVIGPNVPSVYELQFAVPMSGAILNNINPRLDANALSVLLRHSETKLVFVDHHSSSLVLEAVSFLPKNEKPRLVLLQDDVDMTPLSSDVEFLDTYEGVMERGDKSFKWVRPSSEWNPMVLNYTSGTTSSPKGVVLSHRAVFMSTINSLLDWSMPNRPVYLWTLPMFHANGWSYTWATAAVGATNICLRRVDAKTIYESIDKHHVTHMCAAPMVLNMLTNYPARKQLKQPVRVMTAGAPPPETVISSAESLGFDVGHGYGLTETGCLNVSCAWKPEWDGLGESERAKLKSRQGIRTAVFAEVDVRDTLTGESVKHDGVTVGEIVFRGGSVMLGYYKDPEGTAASMREDGWFYTGDMGVMHPDGYLEVKDRSKDVIICGGKITSYTMVHLKSLFTLLFFFIITTSLAVTFAGKIPAVIVFGDSTVDAGNNNYIPTVARSNFEPYGRDFDGGKPTGRFCNGKIATDFMSEAIGLKPTIPAYLDPSYNISDFATGVTFASAATGYDNATSDVLSVLPLWKQLEYYKEYQTKLEAYQGKDRATETITNSLYLISIGTNDFLENYFAFPGRSSQYSVDLYQDFLAGIAKDFVTKLHGLGARKISLGGLPPMGCMPLERATNIGTGGECVGRFNDIAVQFNGKLERLVEKLSKELSGSVLVFSNPYEPFMRIIKNPSSFGFEVAAAACCATGMFEMGYSCQRNNPFTCSNADKYVFWDSFHPTQKTHRIMANFLMNDTFSHFL